MVLLFSNRSSKLYIFTHVAAQAFSINLLENSRESAEILYILLSVLQIVIDER